MRATVLDRHARAKIDGKTLGQVVQIAACAGKQDSTKTDGKGSTLWQLQTEVEHGIPRALGLLGTLLNMAENHTRCAHWRRQRCNRVAALGVFQPCKLEAWKPEF